MRKFWQSGQTLIEVLLAMAVSSLVMPALLTGIVATREGKAQQQQRLQATALMQEAVEATRSVREQNWTTFAVDGTYHPVVVNGLWQLQPNGEVISGFTRSVQVSSAFRNENGQLVENGGQLDPSTKKTLIIVSWPTPFASEVSTTLIFTRYLDNDALEESSTEEFSGGTTNDTSVTTTGGGAVVLASGSIPNWCAPNLQITPLDLPKNGVANAISAIQGKIFAGTGENASGVSYATINITDTKPPIPSITNTFNGFKTNAIFGETNYAYLGTDTNNKEIVILDITGTPSEVGLLTLPAPDQEIACLSPAIPELHDRPQHFYSFNLRHKSGSRPQLGSVGLAGNGRRIVVVGSHAFIAINQAPSCRSLTSPIPAVSTVVGKRPSPDRAVGTYSSAATATEYIWPPAPPVRKQSFSSLTHRSKTGDRPVIGSYDTNGMNPRSVTVVPGNKAITVGSQRR